MAERMQDGPLCFTSEVKALLEATGQVHELVHCLTHDDIRSVHSNHLLPSIFEMCISTESIDRLGQRYQCSLRRGYESIA